MKIGSGVTLLAILGAFVSILIIAIFEGWSLTEVWRMLLIPSAMDYAEVVVKPLSIGVAIAVAYVIRCFVSAGSTTDAHANKGKGATEVFITALVKPFILVFFAWVFSLFIFGG